jgi:hypothetical protein
MRLAGGFAFLALTAAVALLSGVAAAQQSEDEKILDSRSGGTDTPAPRSDDDEELSTTYSSIGLQKVHADFDNVKDAINLDITMIGFRIPTVPWFGVELNLGFTMAPGQIDRSSSSSPTGCGGLLQPPCPAGSTATSSTDFASTNIGAFAVMRSTGKFFAMGKAGYRYMNTSIDELQNDRSGTAWGAGVGYRWNRKGSYAEFGYTKWAEKINALGISISYSYERR